MNSVRGSVFSRTPCVSSETFKHIVAGLTDSAVAVFDTAGAPVAVSTFNASGLSGRNEVTGSLSAPARACGPVVSVRRLRLSGEDLAALGTLRATGFADERRWKGYSLALQNGRQDRIALALDPEIDSRLTQGFLQRVWPLLRDECLGETTRADVREDPLAGSAWSLLDGIDVALFILDKASLMYRLNSAAREMLKEAKVLRRGRGGLFAAVSAENKALREAVAKMADGPGDDGHHEVVFLTNADDGRRIPVTLARYVHDGKPTSFVVATVPLPPRSEQVESLARQMGLSSTEARVAALIQLGYTNREAARLAGLKEQTFNTYAKRVLAKLDVRCRSEMAQLLTWQSNGGRVS